MRQGVAGLVCAPKGQDDTCHPERWAWGELIGHGESPGVRLRDTEKLSSRSEGLCAVGPLAKWGDRRGTLARLCL